MPFLSCSTNTAQQAAIAASQAAQDAAIAALQADNSASTVPAAGVQAGALGAGVTIAAAQVTSLCPAVQTCINTATIPAAQISGLIPAANLPSYVDDVLEFANLAAFPAAGEAGKIYTTQDTNKVYRWTGSVYAEMSAGSGSASSVPASGVGAGNLAAGVTPTNAAGGALAGNYPNPTLSASATLPASQVTAGALGAGVTIPAGQVTGLSAAIAGAVDGSETKVTAGTNVTITGSGTTASPYVVNAAGGGGGGGAPTGAAGGSLAGSYPNPTLSAAGIAQVTAAIPTATDTVLGTVENATAVEVGAGTLDGAVAISPKDLLDALNSGTSNALKTAVAANSSGGGGGGGAFSATGTWKVFSLPFAAGWFTNNTANAVMVTGTYDLGTSFLISTRAAPGSPIVNIISTNGTGAASSAEAAYTFIILPGHQFNVNGTFPQSQFS